MNNNLRIIPLGGGPGMVTNNMYVYAYGPDAIIVDCGIGFPEDKATDDITIPDITFLKSANLKIHGILLTHGHDDHMAALPHILPQIGNPPIFASKLTAGFAADRLENFGMTASIKVISEADQINLGPFTADPIFVTHSVPDTHHYFIHTPVGNIYHGSDYKFDLTPIDNHRPNFKRIVQLSKAGVLCLLSDCLRGERPGFTPSESSLGPAILREIANCPGRLIFTTMSSQIHRLQQAIDIASAHGRQIIFLGRSMERNVETASRLGYLKLPRKAIAHKSKLKKIPDNKLCVIIAGSQGQESSSLTRYASGHHKMIKPKSTDKVVYSTDIIPGNEQSVYQVIDQLSKFNVSVAYGELADDLHVSGHASAGEIQLLMELVDPRFLYPIGGTFRHMRQYARLAQSIGFRSDQVILPHSAQVVELSAAGSYTLAETLPLQEVRINQSKA